MALFHDSAIVGASGNQGGVGGYQISRSLRFNSSDSAYLSRTPASAGNRRTFTVSFWIKKCRNSLSTSQYLLAAGTGTSESTWFAVTFDIGTSTYDELSAGTWTSTGGSTNASLRDSSAWYHIVVSVDTTQATASNRVKTYVNNVLQSTTTVTISQNADLAWNNNVVHYIGARADSGPRNFFDGYIADFHNIDGQALTPSSFAETNATTGQWMPKAYTGSYGTNGFQLKFADNSNNTAATLGKDTSGNGNNWTPNNLSVTAGAGNDSLVDTPTSYGTDTGAGGSVRGNYCTFNPLDKVGTGSPVLSNGNLDYASTSGFSYFWGTVAASSGKWYWEVTITDTPINAAYIAIANTATRSAVGYYGDGSMISGGAYSGASFGTGDVIGVALDLDNGKLFFSKNNVWQGSANPATGANPAFTGLSGSYAPYTGHGTITSYTSLTANFGQRPFAYTAPSGFKALCDTNLPAPVVAKPNTVMDVKLWSGNNTTQVISGLNFESDLIWIKNRSVSGRNHYLFDSVRGLFTSARLMPNTADTESTSTQYLSAASSTSFTLTAGDSGSNNSGETYVGWCWDAGSSTVTNTQGSITSQVRANASAGFSVVTYTGGGSGYSVGHGLGVAPKLYIVKDRNNALAWGVFTTVIDGSLDYLYLNLTDAKADSGSSLPTSTLIYPGQSTSSDYVMYCFAPVAGYSAFGSYTGNGTSDGPFVYTGFRSRWVIFKSTTAATGWFIWDSATNTYNVATKYLAANTSDAEGTYTGLDILSNGLKARSSSGADGFNQSGQTYIYAAFAENPFQYARAR